jgi:hypothetical protein
LTSAHLWPDASQLDDGLGGEWMGEQETLTYVATERSELVELFVGLDPLADDQRVQCMSHRRDGGDDLAVTRTPADVLDETAIDLQDVDPKELQARQGRVPGPEVVEGEFHPKV